MDFEFTDDQLELRDSARTLLAAACPASLVRGVFDGGPPPAALWEQLVALDWPALALPEAHGGLGLGFLELGILVEELGRVVAPTPFLATLTHVAPLLLEAGHTGPLAQIAAGELTGALALAERGDWRPAAVRATATRSGAGWSVRGTKTHVLDAEHATEVLVVARLDGTDGLDGLGAFLVPAADVEVVPVSVLDPTLPMATVTVDLVVGPDRVVLEPGDPTAGRAVERALQQATTAMALSTVATCRAIFETTLQHTKDREQFGRPIGSFQALKHRLADLYLAVEKAASLAYFAALTIAEDDDRRAVATAMAKASAGDCQRLVAADGLQLHGAIGFIWEHDLHLLLKRAKAGDLLFGAAAAHRADLARLLGLEGTAA